MSVSLRRFGMVALASLAVLGMLSALAQAQTSSPSDKDKDKDKDKGSGGTGSVLTPASPPSGGSGSGSGTPAYGAAGVGGAGASSTPASSGLTPYTPPASSGYSSYMPAPAGTARISVDTSSAPQPPPIPSFYGGGYGGWGYGGMGSLMSGYGYGAGIGNSALGALTGAGYFMQSQGQYYKDIMSARLTREQARQAGIETRRRQMQLALDIERNRPTAITLRDREVAADLDMARSAAVGPEIWSGRALNVLLRSIINKGNLNRGPNISLEPSVVRNLNMSDKSTRGNLGLIKGGADLSWPVALQDDKFKTMRERLSDYLKTAARQLKEKEGVEPATLKTLRSDYRELSEALDNNVGSISPTEYIESRRFLNQVNDAIRALANPKLVQWAPVGKTTVAELVDHMAKNGLEFAPATEGDAAAYTAVFNGLRAFESSLGGSR
jgi:hypothetical protein